VEVGGTSTFVTHDVTKEEVRWAETHLKVKSHAPKEHGRLTLRTSAGLSDAQGRPWPLACGSIFFSLFFLVFSVLHMFCTCTCLPLCFFGGSLYFFVPTYGFKILFKSVASSIFFVHLFFPTKFFLLFV
jgi:hypothetical protein